MPPGSHRFFVRALTTDGLASTKPATLAFTIVPPFWQSWWLRILFLMLVSSVVYAAYRLRIARLLELERLRTRIAIDLHDDIGSTLSQIAILSEVARQGMSETQLDPLSDIANLSRESVESIADIVWAIDPKQDCLGDLTRRMRRFANDLFGANGVHVQFRASGEEQDLEINAQVRRQVFLIFKELLHNALRHSACSEIKIDFSLEDGQLCLIIRDDGRGFEPGQIVKGHGLRSTEERAKQSRGSLTIDSTPGVGTMIQVQIPLASRLGGQRGKNYPNG